MAKRGRPQWIPSPRDILNVKSAALACLTIDETARLLRITDKTYTKALRIFPELLNAQKDTEIDIHLVSAKGLVQLLTDVKNPGVRFNAIKRWQECRGSDVWRRGNRFEHAGAAGAPIHITPIEWVTPPKRNSKPRK